MNGPHCDKGFPILHLEGWSRERTHPLPQVVLAVSKHECERTHPLPRVVLTVSKRESYL